MLCLDAETFKAFLRGAVDEAREHRIARHLESCPHCLKALAAIEEVGPRSLRVARTLGEGCFDDDTLQVYLAGASAPDLRNEIEDHLLFCKGCSAALAGLKRRRRGLESAEETDAQVRELVDSILHRTEQREQ